MKNLEFAIKHIELYANDDSADFAIAKIFFLADGNNSHKNPISEEVLRKCAPSALGKFVIGKFNKWMGDTSTHTSDQTILGYVPPNSEIEFIEKDNKLFAVCEAVISKLYATDVYQMFEKDNHRSVSCEFSANLKYDDDEIKNGMDNPVLEFEIHGITILGKNVKPSCKGADMKIIKFSEEDAEEFYNTYSSLNSLKKFAKERRTKMVSKTYKINKTELKDTPWGDINKTDLYKKVMDAKNRDSLVHNVYALVEDGWEDAPSEKLKYPLMELSGDTFYYNRYALSSALTYAKKEKEAEVIAKVEKLYKKFNIEEEENKEMAKKKFEIEGREAWGDVIRKVQSHEGKDAFVDSVEDDHIIFTKDGVRYKVEADVEVGKDDKTVKAEIDWSTLKKDSQQKEFADYPEDDAHSTDRKVKEEVEKDDEDDDDEEDEEEEKKFSLDANADISAYLEMLDNETSEYRKLGKRVLKKMDEDKGLVMSDYVAMAKECDELRKFKEEKEAEAREFEVNKVLAEVEEDLSEEEFANLREEGMACKYEDMKAFTNKVKAFAYNNAKGKSKDDKKKQVTKEFAVMDKLVNEMNKGSLTADEIFNQYL